MNWKKIILLLSIFGAIQFFLLTSLAMQHYPGGTIVERNLEGYSFFTNFFSDLGRTRSWNGTSNTKSNLLFNTSLYGVGGTLFLFFLMLPSLFRTESAKLLAVVATIAGLISAACYIGIANNPLNVDYSAHTLYVRAGFIAFLVMSLFYSLAIKAEPTYPDRYARAFGWFIFILGTQIAIMLLGPRSWSSPFALLLQATAQKVVVYAQILCMLYQAVGAYGIIKIKHP